MTHELDSGARPAFSRMLADHGLSLRRKGTEILQLNLGKLCNLTCIHCHVNAGPKRKEIITRDTIDRILDWLRGTDIPIVDLTGGAPEMIPDFRYLVERLRQMQQVETIIDRCNLTILLERGYEWLADFFAIYRLKVVASMPCYEPANVNGATASLMRVSVRSNSSIVSGTGGWTTFLWISFTTQTALSSRRTKRNSKPTTNGS
jgi:hypothetical protein